MRAAQHRDNNCMQPVDRPHASRRQTTCIPSVHILVGGFSRTVAPRAASPSWAGSRAGARTAS
jgi:hypothetical protein